MEERPDRGEELASERIAPVVDRMRALHESEHEQRGGTDASKRRSPPPSRASRTGSALRARRGTTRRRSARGDGRRRAPCGRIRVARRGSGGGRREIAVQGRRRREHRFPGRRDSPRRRMPPATRRDPRLRPPPQAEGHALARDANVPAFVAPACAPIPDRPRPPPRCRPPAPMLYNLRFHARTIAITSSTCASTGSSGGGASTTAPTKFDATAARARVAARRAARGGADAVRGAVAALRDRLPVAPRLRRHADPPRRRSGPGGACGGPPPYADKSVPLWFRVRDPRALSYDHSSTNDWLSGRLGRPSGGRRARTASRSSTRTIGPARC